MQISKEEENGCVLEWANRTFDTTHSFTTPDSSAYPIASMICMQETAHEWTGIHTII